VRFLVLTSVLSLAACAAPGMLTDGSSVSLGTFTKGALRRGARLPVEGEGYRVPSLWAARETQYATDELVRALEHVAARVAREYPGGLLGIGDLSQRGGGNSVLHRSHENGRDADLIYYATDLAGEPVAPADSMPRYPYADLKARTPLPPDHGVVFGPFTPRLFDVARNWAMVRALLTEPGIEIQYLFMNEKLRQRVLAYAVDHNEEPSIVERAEALLRQPGDSLPHDDHLHVRIFCAQDDRSQGCIDRGPVRWWKKRYKYMAPERRLTDDFTSNIVALLTGRSTWRNLGFFF
jgi:penicillin-insensitive murein endopeptidase